MIGTVTIPAGEVLVLDISRLLSSPWYVKVGAVVLLFGLLFAINSTSRNLLFTEVLTPELTESVFHKMKKSAPLLEIKGEVKGIEVGKGVFDKAKQKMVFPIKIYAERGVYEAMLIFDSDGKKMYQNPAIFLSPALPYGNQVMLDDR